MTFRLNLQGEGDRYVLYRGSYLREMPLLKSQQRVALSAGHLFQRRLDLRNTDDREVRDSWMDTSFILPDGIVFHPDKGIKVVLDAPPLLNLNEDALIQNRGLVLKDGVYESLPGPEFSRYRIEKDASRFLEPSGVKSNPIWRTLARDQALLNDYTDYIFSETKKRFGFTRGMGIHLPVASSKPIIYPWCSRWLYWSHLDGATDLNNPGNQLVGMLVPFE